MSGYRLAPGHRCGQGPPEEATGIAARPGGEHPRGDLGDDEVARDQRASRRQVSGGHDDAAGGRSRWLQGHTEGRDGCGRRRARQKATVASEEARGVGP